MRRPTTLSAEEGGCGGAATLSSTGESGRRGGLADGPGGGGTSRSAPARRAGRRCAAGGRRVGPGRLPGGEAGSGTVLVLGLVAVLAAVAGVLVTVGLLVVTRHRADSAADLAALAAAGRSLSGLEEACRAAAETAEAAGARLVTCRLDGDDAVVSVAVLPPGRLAELGPATGQARAGPTP